MEWGPSRRAGGKKGKERKEKKKEKKKRAKKKGSECGITPRHCMC
jgi:hypothetical protein